MSHTLTRSVPCKEAAFCAGRGRSDDAQLLLLAIARISFLRADEKMRLLDVCPSVEAFRAVSLSALRSISGRNIHDRPWNNSVFIDAAEADMELFARKNISFVHITDPEYPPLLRETICPPFGLYVRGSLPDPAVCAVAIVGTRGASAQGIAAATRLGVDFARAGVCVISGLARGIDAGAHRGALVGMRGNTDGDLCPTCAVLACGPDQIYPPAHRNLAAQIVDARGCLVTEYPPGSELHKYRFPERNRIIAGTARACIVVEAPADSGALISAYYALEEGRDVYVYAKSIGRARNDGLTKLASDGAQAIDSSGEILREWGFAHYEQIAQNVTENPLEALRAELGLVKKPRAMEAV